MLNRTFRAPNRRAGDLFLPTSYQITAHGDKPGAAGAARAMIEYQRFCCTRIAEPANRPSPVGAVQIMVIDLPILEGGGSTANEALPAWASWV